VLKKQRKWSAQALGANRIARLGALYSKPL
jgi:hypothetical protein